VTLVTLASPRVNHGDIPIKMTMVTRAGNEVFSSGNWRMAAALTLLRRLRMLGFMARIKLAVVFLSGMLMVSSCALCAADNSADPHSVPAVNADLGSCSMEFTVKDKSGKPVYAAKVRVHIAYGFVSAHKLDLEVGTNIDGKARFEGLPSKVKRPLRYEAFEGDRQGMAVYDPADNCKAEKEMLIEKPETTPAPQ
jgi:hypothetical protein